MASWQTFQSLAIILGPLLLPKALAFYRSLRTPAASQIKPLPRSASYALALLFITALISLLSTLPIFYPENVFLATQSRFGTTTGVIFTRLRALRPLTAHDDALRESFDTYGKDAKLTYLKFGPAALLSNPLVATPSDANAELYNIFFALPTTLLPHLLHLFLLGLATSPSLLGSPHVAARWRSIALVPALILPALEIYVLVASTTHAQNLQSTRVSDLQPLYWRLPLFRALAFAAVDALLGYGIWLAATGRAFGTPASAGERLLSQMRALDGLNAKVRGLGVVRNGSVRDGGLRARVEGYWRKEEEVMRSVLEDAEVLDAQRAALRRMDGVAVRREVDGFVDTLLTSMPAPAST